MKLKINYDKLGIATSITCAIHCTILPLFISTLPFYGIDILESAAIEWGLIGLAFVFGYLSLQHGYRHHHRKPGPVALFSAGMLLLIINQLTDERFLLLFIPSSAILIICAHALNIYYSRMAQVKTE